MSEEKKIRISYLFEDEMRAYHLASVIFKKGSVYITGPTKMTVIEAFGIEMVEGKPIMTYTEAKHVPSVKASYHADSGFKHIKQDGGEYLAKYNTKEFKESEPIESLLRIFPDNPKKYPFISKIDNNDICVSSKETGGHPIGIIISITKIPPKEIRIEVPESTIGKYKLLRNDIALIVTAFPARVKDVIISDWPKEMLWTTPY